MSNSNSTKKNSGSMRKILYIVPGMGLAPEELERRKRVLNSMASPGFEVDVRAAEDGPPSIESYYDEFMSVPSTLKIAVTAEREGYDALILGCYTDPGLDAVREIVDIPVVGPGESTIHLACTLGEEFTIIAILDSVKKEITRYVKKVGEIDRLASVRAMGVPVAEIGKRSAEVRQILFDVGKKAIAEDGADVLILGCMSEGFLGAAEEMTRKMKVPVLNPVSVSLKTAELLVSCGLHHSRLAYLLPPKLQKLGSKKQFFES